MQQYVYRSKQYLFGPANTVGNTIYSADVHGTVRPGLPTKMIVIAQWGRGVHTTVVFSANDTVVPSLAADEQVKITVNFGRVGVDYTLLDTSTGTDNLNKELDDLSGYLPDSASWMIQFTVTFTVDPTTTPDFVPTEQFNAWTYVNKTTRQPVFRLAPFGVNEIAAYQPVGGIQAQFVARGSNERVATGVSDRGGELTVMLPAGTYDVQLSGWGFTQADWLTGANGISIGTGANAAAFGRTTTDVSKQAEFNTLKSLFANLHWPGYLVPEDFTDARASDRDDPAGTTPATQHFGRIYAGRSFVEYFGIATDPSPL